LAFAWRMYSNERPQPLNSTVILKHDDYNYDYDVLSWNYFEWNMCRFYVYV